jgi:hypothetical protein
MWMKSPGDGLAAVLYGPSRITAVVGKAKRAVEIIEETSYPFSERITFRIRAEQPVEFPLHLRVPAWCRSPRLKVNGKSKSFPAVENGFSLLDRIHRDGDLIEVDFPMEIAVGRSSDGGMFVERGPLVYSLQPKEIWTSIAIPEMEITSPQFPMWAVTAGSPWNYALFIDKAAQLKTQVKVDEAAISADPWSKSPISMRLRARRLPGWDLVRPKGNDANWFKTPPLPPMDSSVGAEETITLVPLGTTHLRLTVFPSLTVAPPKSS